MRTFKKGNYTFHFADSRYVLKSLQDESVDMVVCDPPYGVNYKHGNQSPSGRSSTLITWNSIKGDNKKEDFWLKEAFRALKKGSALYFCCRWDVEPEWRAKAEAVGFLVKQRLQWHKRVNGKGDLRGTYQPTCEDILFCSKGRHVLNHRPSMLLDVGCVPTWEFRWHPHQKPTSLFRVLIEASTQPGDLVLDPFMGSGSVALACAETGRRYIGVEIERDYYESAKIRLRELLNASSSQKATPSLRSSRHAQSNKRSRVSR